MKKAFASMIILLLSVIIAFSSVGCQRGGNEITFSGDNHTSSPGGTSNTQDSSSTEGNPSTVLYVLTTAAGEVIPTVYTTIPTTEPPTMNYDPVTVPTTTQPPTTTEKPTTTESTTASPTTTQPSTSSIKYVRVSAGDDTDGAFTKSKISVYVNAELFPGTVKASKGTLTVNFGPNSYNASYKVLSELYAGEQIEIDVDVPSTLIKAVEADSSGTAAITVSVPQGAITTSENIANKSFTSFSIFYSPD